MGVLRPRTPVRPEHAPPLLPYEVEKFVCFIPGRYERGMKCVSTTAESGLLNFHMSVFPGGDVGFHISEGEWAVSVFVEIVEQAQWPATWEFRNVTFSIE